MKKDSKHPIKAHVYDGAGRNPNNAQHKILRQVSPNSRVLEFGAAYGFMTKYLKEKLGCSIFVVELDPAAAEVGASWATRTITGDIENYEWLEAFKDLKFDYILFADVLEHLYDPWTVARRASTLLAPGGKVVLSVPNVAHSAVVLEILSGHFTYGRMGLLDNTHIRFFTLDSILALIDAAGLSAVSLDAVCKLPDATMLRRSYAEVSFWTGFTIARRKYAHVTQFIVIASAKHERPADARMFDRIAEQNYGLWKHLRNHVAYRLSRK